MIIEGKNLIIYVLCQLRILLVEIIVENSTSTFG